MFLHFIIVKSSWPTYVTKIQLGYNKILGKIKN